MLEGGIDIAAFDFQEPKAEEPTPPTVRPAAELMPSTPVSRLASRQGQGNRALKPNTPPPLPTLPLITDFSKLATMTTNLKAKPP